MTDWSVPPSDQGSFSARVLLVTLSSLLAVLPVLGVALTAGGAEDLAQHDSTAIDAYVEAEMNKAAIPGLALGVVQGNSVVYLRGFGGSGLDGQEVTPQTPFIIASLSKSVTALAVMQLVEKGAVDLDAPLQSYIPWFGLADPHAAATITVRHLLNHRSGISSGEDRLLLVTEPGMTLEQHVRRMRDLTLTHPPGTAFQYSSWNYLAAGLLVEALSGQPYQDYIRHNIFAPLDMHNSFTSQVEATDSGMATGHRWCFGFAVPSSLPYPADLISAGYVISSAEDMAHFLIANINQGQYGDISVLSAEGMAEMHRPVAGSGQEGGYGMGWATITSDGRAMLMHDGFAPGFFASMAIEPGRELGVIVLTNASNLYAPKMAGRIAEGVMDMFAGRQPEATGRDFRTFYLIVNIVVTGLTPLLVLSLLRIRTWRTRLLEIRPAGLRSVSRHVVLPIMGDFVLPFVLLYFIPTGAGFPFWSAMRLFQPDLAYWALAMAIALLVGGVIRIALASSVLRAAGRATRTG